ncbi:replication licensing factor Cdt1, partial [Coemansia sp. RSA 1836]
RSVIYHRARAGVEAMAKRTFGWRELGQILALLPDAYACTAVPAVHNGRRVVSVELTPRTGGGLDLAVEIDARRRQFAHALGARVDAAHRAFLADRGYADADVDALRGAWHPAFDVESTPHVTPLPLPPAPAAAAGPVAAFDRARLRHLLNEKDKEEEEKEEEKEKPPAVLALPPTPASSPALAPADAAPKKKPRPPPGTAKNLLERIREKQRAREAAQLAEAAGANAVPLATRTMHSRLPGILETLSFLFYTERHSVLPYFYVVDKLAESKCLERADASAHIIALAGFVPEWCSISDHSETLPSLPDHSEAPDGAAKLPNATVGPLAEPSPEARLTITRTISMQEAKARLIAKL